MIGLNRNLLSIVNKANKAKLQQNQCLWSPEVFWYYFKNIHKLEEVLLIHDFFPINIISSSLGDPVKKLNGLQVAPGS